MAKALWPHEAARNQRAARRAKAILKPGDRLYVATCGGRGVTVTMVGWSADFPDFIASKTLDGDELHPINVRKLNGKPITFDDPVSVTPRQALTMEGEGD